MKNIIKIPAFALLTALFFAACGPKQKTAAAPAAKPADPAVECMAKTALTPNSFQNDCIGLYFKSAAPFLYAAGPSGQSVTFAVPKKDYSIEVLIFQNDTAQINTPEGRKAFIAAAGQHILSQNPGFKITKEEITSFNNVPAVYIAASGKGRVERNYFFNNKGRWARLTMSSTDKDFSQKIKPAQDAVIKTVRLY